VVGQKRLDPVNVEPPLFSRAGSLLQLLAIRKPVAYSLLGLQDIRFQPNSIVDSVAESLFAP
jgi:hypothetical protein